MVSKLPRRYLRHPFSWEKANNHGQFDIFCCCLNYFATTYIGNPVLFHSPCSYLPSGAWDQMRRDIQSVFSLLFDAIYLWKVFLIVHINYHTLHIPEQYIYLSQVSTHESAHGAYSSIHYNTVCLLLQQTLII